MTWNRTLILILLGTIGLFFYPFGISLLVGIIFSLTLHPFVLKLPQSWSKKRKVCLVTSVFTLILVIPISLIIFFGAIEGKALFNNISEMDYSALVRQGFNWFNGFESISFLFNSFQINVNNIEENILKLVLSTKNWIFIILQNIITSIPFIIFSFALIVATVFFALLDGESVKKTLLENNLYSKQFGKRMIEVFDGVSQSVVIATLGSALAQAAVILLPTLIFNFKYTLLVVFATFIFSFIPVLGTAPVILTLLITCFIREQWTAFIVYGIFALILGSVDNIIRASIISSRVKVNPFIAFLATLGGLNIIGFWGIFIGPVVVITAIKLVDLLLEPHHH